MTYQEAQQLNQPYDRITQRLLGGSRLPFHLPIYREFGAPASQDNFDRFIAAYRATGWDWEAAIQSFADQDLVCYFLFRNTVTNDYFYCSAVEYARVNGIRIRWST